MISLAFSLLVQSLTCPRGSFLAHGIQGSTFGCYVDTDAGVRLVSRHTLHCARGTSAVVMPDGKSARCVRLRSESDKS